MHNLLSDSERTGNTRGCCVRRSDRRVAGFFKVDVMVIKVVVKVEEVSSSSSSSSSPSPS